METRPARAVSIVFAWVAITTFSGVLIETLLIYPNIFGDVPTFETGHWLRLVLCGATAVLAFSVLLRVLAGRRERAPVGEVV